MLYLTTICVVECQLFYDGLGVNAEAFVCAVNWAIGGLHDVLSLLVSFHEFEMPDDMKHRFRQVCGIVLPVIWDCWYQSRVVGSDIHQHSGLKVHFGALTSVRGAIGQETNDFVESGLVVACVIVHVLEVGQLFFRGFVDNPWGAHRIDLLEAFLEGITSFWRALSFDDWLIWIRNELGYYAGCFAHCQVVLFLFMHNGVYEDVWLELCICKAFPYKAFSDRFDCRSFSLIDCPLSSLLPELAHYVRFPSRIVFWASEDEERFLLGFSFVRHFGKSLTEL